MNKTRVGPVLGASRDECCHNYRVVTDLVSALVIPMKISQSANTSRGCHSIAAGLRSCTWAAGSVQRLGLCFGETLLRQTTRAARPRPQLLAVPLSQGQCQILRVLHESTAVPARSSAVVRNLYIICNKSYSAARIHNGRESSCLNEKRSGTP